MAFLAALNHYRGSGAVDDTGGFPSTVTASISSARVPSGSNTFS
jgi:hypothetical protein